MNNKYFNRSTIFKGVVFVVIAFLGWELIDSAKEMNEININSCQVSVTERKEEIDMASQNLEYRPHTLAEGFFTAMITVNPLLGKPLYEMHVWQKSYNIDAAVENMREEKEAKNHGMRVPAYPL